MRSSGTGKERRKKKKRIPSTSCEQFTSMETTSDGHEVEIKREQQQYAMDRN